MPKVETHELLPFGSATDPEEERFPLATLDYLCAVLYVSYAIFFKIDDDSLKPKISEILKQGLEKTLSQTRHLCGTIERNDDGSHSFVKKRDSTVKYVVQYADGPEDTDFPTFSYLESQHFVTRSLGDKIDAFSNAPMTYGVKPEAQFDNHPKVAS